MLRFLSLVLFLAAPASLSAAAPLAGRRPNIILIITDDQGWADLSCHGNPILKTPNLDRLHREGARFTDFQVSPTCAPTRSALLTGRHEFRNGITHTIEERERLAPDAVTLADTLKAAGYATGIFGKWHLGDQPDYWPAKRGYSESFFHGAGGIGQSYPGSCGDAPGNSYFNPFILHNGTFEKTSGYCTDVFFSTAMKWMESIPPSQPFFAHIATNAPHGPLHVRPEDEARYKDKVPPQAAKFFGMIANIDDNTGRLLQWLADHSLERDTLVLFMNDNGGTAGISTHSGGLRGTKGSPWQGGVRAASFWRWPGAITPADISAPAAHLDVFPTLAAIAGAPLSPAAQKQIEGRSLVPLLENPAAPWPDRTLVTHVGRWPRGKAADSKFHNCAIRNSRWKIVSTAPKTPGWQLFDLSTDPGEQSNVATSHPDVVKELAAAYDSWWTSILPALVNENAPVTGENTFKTLFNQQFPNPSTPR
jgi:arylsulfatase